VILSPCTARATAPAQILYGRSAENDVKVPIASPPGTFLDGAKWHSYDRTEFWGPLQTGYRRAGKQRGGLTEVTV